jgi:hypothetical protein
MEAKARLDVGDNLFYASRLITDYYSTTLVIGICSWSARVQITSYQMQALFLAWLHRHFSYRQIRDF